MKLLQEKPLSGYDLVKEVESRTGWKPSYGAIYPLLKSMKEEGLVSCEAVGRRKVYKLTREGLSKGKELDQAKEELCKALNKKLTLLNKLTGSSYKWNGHSPNFLLLSTELEALKKALSSNKLIGKRLEEARGILRRAAKELKALR